MKLPHLFTGGTLAQIIAGPGGWYAGDDFCRIDIHVVAIVIPYDFNGGVALFSKIHGTPLTQTGTCHPAPVAVGGEDGLPYAGAGEIIGKNGIYKVVNIPENISSVHPFLVIGRGGGDGEVVTLVPVPRNRC